MVSKTIEGETAQCDPQLPLNIDKPGMQTKQGSNLETAGMVITQLTSTRAVSWSSSVTMMPATRARRFFFTWHSKQCMRRSKLLRIG